MKCVVFGDEAGVLRWGSAHAHEYEGQMHETKVVVGPHILYPVIMGADCSGFADVDF